MPNYYSTQFSPPAPVALVTLRNPENGTERPEVVMLLDTGADVTLLPQSIVEDHSPSEELKKAASTLEDDKVKLLLPAKLAQLSVEYGMASWVIDKAQ